MRAINGTMRPRIRLPFFIVLALLVAACGSADPEPGTDASGSDAKLSPETPADEASDAASQSSPEDASDGSGASSSSPEDASDGSGASSSSPEDASDGSGASSSSPEDMPTASEGGIPADADLTDSVSVGSGDDIEFSEGFGVRNTDPFNSGEPAPPLENRSPAAISDVQFQVMESWPAQVAVIVSGDLPSPCHDLWWEVDIEGNAYDIKVWSVGGLDGFCAAVIEPFTEDIFLGGGFVDDDYTVIVNGEEHSLSF